MTFLELKGIGKRFGRTQALGNVDLVVSKGEYVVIVGPTAAGKTTLLKIVAGLVRQDAGEVWIDDQRVDHLPPEQRKIAYLPQSYSLFPHLDVMENTVFGPKARGWTPQRIKVVGREMLAMVHLYGRRDAYPNELSGGMSQRCALARALAADAHLLLLDEPLRALDARLRLELREEIKRLARDMRLTTLHVTHDQEEAMAVADRIVVLRHGTIVQEGRPWEIFSAPTTPFVAHFVGEANFITGTARKLGDAYVLVDEHGMEHRCGSGVAKEGERAVAGIKVEHTRLERTGGMAGRVERASFLGRYIAYEVHVPEKGRFVARLPSRGAPLFDEGEDVSVVLEPRHLRIFPLPEHGLTKDLEVE
ncbi:MAG: ABC transporter ATP-binding protein [Candidatus Thermoplasmatota archaeon]